ncbi:MAG: hypothetical protein WA790_18585 [Sulfitobacter sp.]
MEIIETTIISLATAVVGGLFGSMTGYFFASRKESRRLGLDVVMRAVSDDFTEKRLEIIRVLENEDTDLKALADRSNESHAEFRKAIFSILNTYTLYCNLFHKGDIDADLFNENLLGIIAADYSLFDGFLREFEIYQRHNGGELMSLPLCSGPPL